MTEVRRPRNIALNKRVILMNCRKTVLKAQRSQTTTLQRHTKLMTHLLRELRLGAAIRNLLNVDEVSVDLTEGGAITEYADVHSNSDHGSAVADSEPPVPDQHDSKGEHEAYEVYKSPTQHGNTQYTVGKSLPQVEKAEVETSSLRQSIASNTANRDPRNLAL